MVEPLGMACPHTTASDPRICQVMLVPADIRRPSCRYSSIKVTACHLFRSLRAPPCVKPSQKSAVKHGVLAVKQPPWLTVTFLSLFRKGMHKIRQSVRDGHLHAGPDESEI